MPLMLAIKKVIRPATALTRRKEITIKMAVPREIFEELMEPMMDGDLANLVRDEVTGKLLPTSTAIALAPACAHNWGPHLNGRGRAVGGGPRGGRPRVLSPQPHQDSTHTPPPSPRSPPSPPSPHLTSCACLQR